MRFLLYNIRYGTGGTRPIMPWNGYLRRTMGTLCAIAAFIEEAAPDIIGLLEVDAGSYRSDGHNQAKLIANMLGHYHSYQRKYGAASLTRYLPLFKNQGNAFIVRDRIHNEKFHYFNKGVKKLVIELQLERLDVFLVHLALGFRTRQGQLRELAELVNAHSGPHIVAGDFNPIRGRRELNGFLEATGLSEARRKPIPTFPSWAPRRQLDYILFSPGIHVTSLSVPRVEHSDHLPLICDFEVRRGRPAGAKSTS